MGDGAHQRLAARIWSTMAGSCAAGTHQPFGLSHCKSMAKAAAASATQAHGRHPLGRLRTIGSWELLEASFASASGEPGMAEGKKVFTLKDVSSHDFVVEYAQHLKKTGKMDVPKWVDIAKTGPFKERASFFTCARWCSCWRDRCLERVAVHRNLGLAPLAAEDTRLPLRAKPEGCTVVDVELGRPIVWLGAALKPVPAKPATCTDHTSRSLKGFACKVSRGQV